MLNKILPKIDLPTSSRWMYFNHGVHAAAAEKVAVAVETRQRWLLQ